MSAPRGGRGLSFGWLALLSLGSAATVLLVATILVSVLRPGPGIGLVIVLAGVVGAIAAMGLVSTRLTRRALDEADDDPGTGPSA